MWEVVRADVEDRHRGSTEIQKGSGCGVPGIGEFGYFRRVNVTDLTLFWVVMSRANSSDVQVGWWDVQ